MIFNTLLAHGVRPNHSDNRVRMAQYISMYPAERGQCRRARRAHPAAGANSTIPKRDAFPGDPRDWEKKNATNAKLTDARREAARIEELELSGWGRRSFPPSPLRCHGLLLASMRSIL